MRTITAGGDIGFHALKLVVDDGQRVYIPNVIKEVAGTVTRPILSDDEKTIDTIDIHIRCPHYPALHNRRVYVGNLAIGNGEYQVSATSRKTQNDLILIPLLAGLALEADYDGEELEVDAMIGLPMLEYLNRADREMFKQKITGTYEIEFYTTARREGWKVTIRLNPTITAEGLGVIFHQMTDTYGRIIRTDWKGEAMGAIDIGGSSTDIAIIGEDHKPDASLCRGLQLGVATALDQISQAIEKEHGVSFPRHMIEKFITKDHCMMRLGAHKFSIKEIVTSNFTAIANQIEQAIMELVKNPKASQVVRFFVFGGGAIDYKEFLDESLRSKIYSELVWLTDDVEQSIFLNAESFYRMMKTKKKIITPIITMAQKA